jgi:hypothetical protein
MYPAVATATFDNEPFLIEFNGLVVKAQSLRNLPHGIEEGGVARVGRKGPLVCGQGARILRKGLIDL